MANKSSKKKINENMVEKKGSRSSIKTFLCLLILVIAGLVYIDIRQEGSWKASKIGMSLNYYGVHTYVSKAVCVSKKSWSWVDTRIEENFPGYQKTLSDVTAPYVQLFSDLVKIVYNGFCNVKESFVEKYPVILQTVDSYAPGLIEQSQKTVTNIYATSIFYYDRSVDYLQKEVFVGQLSPQNVQRVVIEAFNTTQQKATEYYHWIYEKVQTSIK